MPQSDFVLVRPEVVRDVDLENEALREQVRVLRGVLVEVSMKLGNALYLFDLDGNCQRELRAIQGLADSAARV